MSKWHYISIKDDKVVGLLPEAGETVILTIIGGYVTTDVFDYVEEGGFFEDYDFDEVLAWMPMPEPYTGEEDEPERTERSRILRAVGRYIQTQHEEHGLSALGVNGTVYCVEDVLQELDAIIREEEGEA